MEFQRIGGVKDPAVEANLVELQKVIRALNDKIKTLEAQVKNGK